MITSMALYMISRFLVGNKTESFFKHLATYNVVISFDFHFSKASFKLMDTNIWYFVTKGVAFLSVSYICHSAFSFKLCGQPLSITVLYKLKYSFPQTFLQRSLFRHGKVSVCLNLMCLNIKNSFFVESCMCLCIFVTVSTNTVYVSYILAMNSILR